MQGASKLCKKGVRNQHVTYQPLSYLRLARNNTHVICAA